jgi:hypothetical protein
MQCEIYDQRGRAEAPLDVVLHPSAGHRSEDSARRGTWFLSLGVISLFATVPLFYYDYTHRGFLIWPSLIAVNLVAVGLRLILWGRGILEQRRRQGLLRVGEKL